jgi:hypothetical protein
MTIICDECGQPVHEELWCEICRSCVGCCCLGGCERENDCD